MKVSGEATLHHQVAPGLVHPIEHDQVGAGLNAGEGLRPARIDLDDQTVDSAAGVVRFEIDEEVKHRLLHGLDEIALTLRSASAIDEFEARAAPRTDTRAL